MITTPWQRKVYQVPTTHLAKEMDLLEIVLEIETSSPETSYGTF